MITGKEPVNGSACAIEGSHHIEEGESLYERTLREFMCAMITGLWSNAPKGESHGWSDRDIADKANDLTEAYINQLNKQQS